MRDYFTLLDYPDIGEMVSFFACESNIDERMWTYKYALQFRSTMLFGGEGRVGDGDDIILAEGQIEDDALADSDYDVEEFLNSFAEENAPVLSEEIETEFHMDDDLCAISEYLRYDSHSFEDAVRDELGIDEDNGMAEYAAMLKDYAEKNGWTF